MKKTYVKPMMESEEFVANEYVATCYRVTCTGCGETDYVQLQKEPTFDLYSWKNDDLFGSDFNGNKYYQGKLNDEDPHAEVVIKLDGQWNPGNKVHYVTVESVTKADAHPNASV